MTATSKIPHDAFVNKIVGDPKQPPDTLMLSGYVGNSSDEAHTRLYFDPQLSSYVEIPDEAILHRQEITHSPLGGSHVWIKRDAVLVHGPIGPNRRKAAFLEGPLTAAAAPLPMATLPPALCTLAAPQCGAGTHLGPQCGHVTAPAVCHPTTPLTGCNHTHLPQCHPTLPPACHPTQLPLCHPTTPQTGCHPTTPVAGCHPTTPAAHCPPITQSPACFPTEVGPHCSGPTSVSAHCPTNVLHCPADTPAAPAPTLIPQHCLPHTQFGPACPATLTGPACHVTQIGPACTHTLTGPACLHPTLLGPNCPVHTLIGPACQHTLSGPACVHPTLAGPQCPVHTLIGPACQLVTHTPACIVTHGGPGCQATGIPGCAPSLAGCPSIACGVSLACHPGGGLPGAGG